LAVATILAELGMTAPTLAAALLHDTVEDTGYTLEEVKEDFGEEIAALVDGVTKLDQVKYGDTSAAETVRKMVVAMARDIRVLVIKLADRLHNMRTLGFMPAEKQEKKARETLEIYAPLAHRLGMNTMKWELEDLAFANLYPKIFEEIERLVSQRAPSREQYLTQVITNIETDLRAARIKVSVTGRPKHLYSVYQKMVVRGRDFADIYDLVGVRILVESVRDCYAVLGIIHSRWSPVPGRFKDFIAMPKFNMYQSLHTTVIGPEGKPVELQIRTWDMHRAAEFGVAAHWRYKQRDVGGKQGPDGFGNCWSGNEKPRTQTSSSMGCATTCHPRRSLSSRPRAMSWPFRRAVPRWTSPIACTRRWGIGAWVPVSTASWCRWIPNSPTGM
jgi:GTP pyrophosphokinase